MPAGSAYGQATLFSRVAVRARQRMPRKAPLHTGKLDSYLDTKMEEPFLVAMAEGCYQAGDPTKLYFPVRMGIRAAGSEPAPAATGKPLGQQDNAIDSAAVDSISSTSKRREVMLHGSVTRVGQSLSSIESPARGLWTWDVR